MGNVVVGNAEQRFLFRVLQYGISTGLLTRKRLEEIQDQAASMTVRLAERYLNAMRRRDLKRAKEVVTAVVNLGLAAESTDDINRAWRLLQERGLVWCFRAGLKRIQLYGELDSQFANPEMEHLDFVGKLQHVGGKIIRESAPYAVFAEQISRCRLGIKEEQVRWTFVQSQLGPTDMSDYLEDTGNSGVSNYHVGVVVASIVALELSGVQDELLPMRPSVLDKVIEYFMADTRKRTELLTARVKEYCRAELPKRGFSQELSLAVENELFTGHSHLDGLPVHLGLNDFISLVRRRGSRKVRKAEILNHIDSHGVGSNWFLASSAVKDIDIDV